MLPQGTLHTQAWAPKKCKLRLLGQHFPSLSSENITPVPPGVGLSQAWHGTPLLALAKTVNGTCKYLALGVTQAKHPKLSGVIPRLDTVTSPL